MGKNDLSSAITGFFLFCIILMINDEVMIDDDVTMMQFTFLLTSVQPFD